MIKNQKQKTEASIIQSTVSNTDKLIVSNNKLKQEIHQLLIQLDQIIEQTLLKKNQVKKQDDSGDIKKVQKQINSQQGEIKQNRQQIEQLKKFLMNNLDLHKLTNVENQVKALKQQDEKLKQEQESLNKVIKNQDKALKGYNDDEFEQQLEEVNREIHEKKEKQKELMDEQKKINQKLKKIRDLWIQKKQKIEELEQKIREHKKMGQINLNKESMDQLKEEIEFLEDEKQMEDKKQQEKLKGLEGIKYELKSDLDKKLQIWEQRQKEHRNNKLRLQEFVRLLKQNDNKTPPKIGSKPNFGRKNSADVRIGESRKSTRSGSEQNRKDKKDKETKDQQC